jgi:hypothetical protein
MGWNIKYLFMLHIVLEDMQLGSARPRREQHR